MRAAWVSVAVLVVVGVGAACAGPSTGAAPPSGDACSPSVTITGHSDALDGASVAGTPVTGLSGLAVDRDGTVLALSDRSTLLTLDAATRSPLRATPLADEAGQPLDSESLAVEPDGTRVVTSEVEPSIRRYDPAGGLRGRLDVVPDLRVAPPGRAARNRTLEGVASLDGTGALVASMEGALAGDDPGVRRFPTWRADGRPGPQLSYRPDDGLDVSEIAATGDGRLLVLERTFTRGRGNTVHLVLADPRGAADVATQRALGANAPVMRRTLLADLGACPSQGATAQQAQANPLLDNIEGMTVVGSGPGGLHLLLVSDDNQNAAQTTRLYDLVVGLPPP